MSNWKMVISEARPSVGSKVFVTDLEGRPIAAGLLQTDDHQILRFAKDMDTLTAEKGWDFQIAFAKKDGPEVIHGFKTLANQLGFSSNVEQSATEETPTPAVIEEPAPAEEPISEEEVE